MKKGFAGLVLSAVMIFSMTGTGCGENGTDSTENALTAEISESKEEHKIDISEIDWNVSASVVNGERITALNYTNNSGYPIIDFKIKFTQKPDLTEEEFAVLNDVKEKYEYEDNEIRDIYVAGESKKYTEPGQKVSDIPCEIDDWYELDDISILDIMRPDMATIEYIDTDGKGYTMYYDFLNESYGKSSDGGQELQNWSDSELASMIPKPEAYKIDISGSLDNWFSFDAYGMSFDAYTEYVEKLKANGFTAKYSTISDNDFYGSKDDITVTVYYRADNEKIDVTVSR
ncbi:DUF6591 domain-containing protein [Huintestinicola sp.]